MTLSSTLARTLARTLDSRLGLLGLAVFVSALFAPSAGAELAPWDQGRVTAIAQQLPAACEAWLQALRDQPDSGFIGSGDAESGTGLVQKAQMLQEQSTALAGHLAAGQGYDKTRDLYRSLEELIDDTEVQAQRAELDQPALAAWAKIADLQRQIAPYYDPKALERNGQGAAR